MDNFYLFFFLVILMDRLIEKTKKKIKENNNNSDKKNMRISDGSLFKSTNHVFLRFRCLSQGYLVFSYRLSLILSFSYFFLLFFFFSRKTGHNEIAIIDNITPQARNSPTNSNRRCLVFSIHVMVHIIRIMYI